MPDPSLARRLQRVFGDLGRELGGGFGAYLRAAFLPDRIWDAFPLRLASEVGSAFAHPFDVFAGARVTDEIERKRRRRFVPILAASAAVHGALLVYLVYVALFSAFADLNVVNKDYRKFDPSILTVHLKYPPNMLKAPQGDKTLTIEEIRERAKKRREEMARRREREEKEKAERERIERERAEKEKKEAEQKAAELAAKEKPKSNTEFGEINEAPIKDMVGEVYSLFQAGTLDVGLPLNVMAVFKIEKDGSLSGIRIARSSKNKLLDEKAAQILWMIGESHALGPIADLSSGSVELDLTENTSRLTVTAFAQTPEAAKAKADLLNFLFAVMKVARKKDSPDVAELLSMLKVTSDNKRVDARLSVSRARATQMMNARFGSKQ
ncbi:MAG TPA: hypothetical protein VLE20_12820 [Blastocatellia bacterium]|jgi:hypothetical protein|nr:hypothetical protein [Blastocatellia bacterium]